MASRRDGHETRQRLIAAACDVFARRGLHNATVAEICELAHANGAAVNYHFGSKEQLYIEVWRYAAQRANQLYPFDGGVPPDAPAEDRLRGQIDSLLRRMTDDSELGAFHRLLMRELVNPTPLTEEVRREFREPMREQLRGLIRELLGPAVDEHALGMAELSIVGQCRAVRHAKSHWKELTGRSAMTEDDRLAFVDHLTRFSLAGIRAMREAAPTPSPQPAGGDPS